MITEEERQSIINEAVERTLLSLPETVGNLIANHIAMEKVNSKFYADYPEFRNNKPEVVSVIEMVEGEHPLESYESILKKAIPKIRERIGKLNNLDMHHIDNKPNRTFESLDIGEADNSNPHGEI